MINDSQNLYENVLFELTLNRLPKVSFFGKSLTLPSLSIGAANVPTPFTSMPLPGDHIVFSPLDLTFMIDDKFDNYNEVLGWMTEIGFPSEFSQYNTRRMRSEALTNDKVSDGSITLFSVENKPKLRFNFESMWPSDLGTINIDIQKDMVDYLECSVTFQYTKFTLEKIS